MENRRVAGKTGMLTLTALLLVALLGCPLEAPPGDQETTTPEKPIEDSPELANQGLLDDFAMLERFAGTGEVILRVSAPGAGKQEPSVCDRKIKVQTYGPTIFWEPNFSPIEVTWRVAQSPFGSWMEGDRIHIDRKVSTDDPCFSAEPFDINYPDLDVESDQPMQNCKIELPWLVLWHYKATLFNEECRSEENPDGQVAEADPLVIIKKRP